MNRPVDNFEPVANEAVAFLGTDPVPTRPFRDPDYFEVERKAIFRRSWLHVGRESEVAKPGDYIVRAIEAANISILIIHGRDGKVRAFHNMCMHRGTQLLWDEAGRAANISCPYHRWTYSDAGRLIGVPDEERFVGLDRSACNLKSIHLESCGGFLFVNLSVTPGQDLRSFLGEVADKLEEMDIQRYDHFWEYTYEVESNWKATYDNFQENYHIRFVHDKSIGRRSTSAANPFGYPSNYSFYGPHRSMGLWGNRDYQPLPVEKIAFQRVAQVDDEKDRMPEGTEYFGIFPNLLLSTRRRNICFTQQMWPISVDRTHCVVRVYWLGKDKSASMRFAREFAVGFLMGIHSEDIELIEMNHRGISSGALETMPLQSQEALCRHFFNNVEHAVNDYLGERRQGDHVDA